MRLAILFIGLWLIVTSASAAELSLELPVCKLSPANVFPNKYEQFAQERQDFNWLREVDENTYVIRGNGPEVGVDGSQLYSYFEFNKIDINNDGWCDWIVTALAPVDNHGANVVLNTIYLGDSSGWSRVGADIPDDRPDLSGYERNSTGSAEFTYFSDGPFVVRSINSHPITYIIGAITPTESIIQGGFYGYRVYVWDKNKGKLRALDKWQPGSQAALVYSFFKEYGASAPVNEKPFPRVYNFRHEVEKEEFDRACRYDWILTESEYFAALCKTHSSGEMPDQKATEHMATKPEKRLPASYAEMLEYSPALRIQDTYLNQAYRYLTTGQTILHEVPPGSKTGFYYCGLPREEIKALKTEQRAWIKARDKQALEAGAFGTDAYIAALLEITKKRNVELKALIEKHPPKDDACRQLLPKE